MKFGRQNFNYEWLRDACEKCFTLLHKILEERMRMQLKLNEIEISGGKEDMELVI